MSGPLRSKHGCWTCRLRKKKCDELQPQCKTCISLAITCYGFGPKPEWMDSTEQKRIVANNLAEMARNQAASRKSTSRPSRESGRFSKLAPKPVDNSIPLGVGSQPDEGLRKDMPLTSKPNNGDYAVSVKPPTINPTEEDYVLLMHFLDSVFALQLPLYKPDVADGGRGWLLSMILRTEPLYHAVLALSAYHRRIIMPLERTRELQMENFQYQADHLAICLAMVNKSANGSCSKDGSGIGITAAIIQLLFFELFTSHSNGWQAHLHVLSRMFQHVHTNELKGIGLCDESRYILLCRKKLQNQGIDVRDEVVGFRTFASSVVWLDIIFSVTTGTAPSTWSESLFSDESTCQVQLQDIIGCQNWAMIQIGRVAQLYTRKNQATQVNDVECGELIQAAKGIQARIELGLKNLGISDPISSGNPALHGATDLDTVALITYTYAQATLIYLHLVIHGFSNLEYVEAPISKVIQSLQHCIKPDSRPALVLPIYICGSVAGGSDGDFIRSVLSNPPLMNPSLQHREKVLHAIEEIWLQRQTKPLYTWTDLLSSSSNILLH